MDGLDLDHLFSQHAKKKSEVVLAVSSNLTKEEGNYRSKRGSKSKVDQSGKGDGVVLSPRNKNDRDEVGSSTTRKTDRTSESNEVLRKGPPKSAFSLSEKEGRSPDRGTLPGTTGKLRKTTGTAASEPNQKDRVSSGSSMRSLERGIIERGTGEMSSRGSGGKHNDRRGEEEESTSVVKPKKTSSTVKLPTSGTARKSGDSKSKVEKISSGESGSRGVVDVVGSKGCRSPKTENERGQIPSSQTDLPSSRNDLGISKPPSPSESTGNTVNNTRLNDNGENRISSKDKAERNKGRSSRDDDERNKGRSSRDDDERNKVNKNENKKDDRSMKHDEAEYFPIQERNANKEREYKEYLMTAQELATMPTSVSVLHNNNNDCSNGTSGKNGTTRNGSNGTTRNGSNGIQDLKVSPSSVVDLKNSKEKIETQSLSLQERHSQNERNSYSQDKYLVDRNSYQDKNSRNERGDQGGGVSESDLLTLEPSPSKPVSSATRILSATSTEKLKEKLSELGPTNTSNKDNSIAENGRNSGIDRTGSDAYYEGTPSTVQQYQQAYEARRASYEAQQRALEEVQQPMYQSNSSAQNQPQTGTQSGRQPAPGIYQSQSVYRNQQQAEYAMQQAQQLQMQQQQEVYQNQQQLQFGRYQQQSSSTYGQQATPTVQPNFGFLFKPAERTGIGFGSGGLLQQNFLKPGSIVPQQQQQPGLGPGGLSGSFQPSTPSIGFQGQQQQSQGLPLLQLRFPNLFEMQENARQQYEQAQREEAQQKEILEKNIQKPNLVVPELEKRRLQSGNTYLAERKNLKVKPIEAKLDTTPLEGGIAKGLGLQDGGVVMPGGGGGMSGNGTMPRPQNLSEMDRSYNHILGGNYAGTEVSVNGQQLTLSPNRVRKSIDVDDPNEEQKLIQGTYLLDGGMSGNSNVGAANSDGDASGVMMIRSDTIINPIDSEIVEVDDYRVPQTEMVRSLLQTENSVAGSDTTFRPDRLKETHSHGSSINGYQSSKNGYQSSSSEAILIDDVLVDAAKVKRETGDSITQVSGTTGGKTLKPPTRNPEPIKSPVTTSRSPTSAAKLPLNSTEASSGGNFNSTTGIDMSVTGRSTNLNSTSNSGLARDSGALSSARESGALSSARESANSIGQAREGAAENAASNPDGTRNSARGSSMAYLDKMNSARGSAKTPVMGHNMMPYYPPANDRKDSTIAGGNTTDRLSDKPSGGATEKNAPEKKSSPSCSENSPQKKFSSGFSSFMAPVMSMMGFGRSSPHGSGTPSISSQQGSRSIRSGYFQDYVPASAAEFEQSDTVPARTSAEGAIQGSIPRTNLSLSPVKNSGSGSSLNSLNKLNSGVGGPKSGNTHNGIGSGTSLDSTNGMSQGVIPPTALGSLTGQATNNNTLPIKPPIGIAPPTSLIGTATLMGGTPMGTPMAQSATAAPTVGTPIISAMADPMNDHIPDLLAIDFDETLSLEFLERDVEDLTAWAKNEKNMGNATRIEYLKFAIRKLRLAKPYTKIVILSLNVTDRIQKVLDVLDFHTGYFDAILGCDVPPYCNDKGARMVQIIAAIPDCKETGRIARTGLLIDDSASNCHKARINGFKALNRARIDHTLIEQVINGSADY